MHSRLSSSSAPLRPGGGFAQYAGPLVEIIHQAEPSLRIEPRTTGGSTENVPLLEIGEVDVALVAGEPAHAAFEGIGRPRSDLKIIAAMYSMPGMFVVRADSPYKSIRDLTGKPVAFGARASGLVVLARTVLDGMGLDADKDFQAVYLERAGDGPAMVLDGRVAALWGGGIGWPGFTAVAKSPGGAHFIGPDAEESARIRAKYTALKALTVPAGSFPGQNTPILSVGSWSFILARPRCPTTWLIGSRARCITARCLRQAADGSARNHGSEYRGCRPARRPHPSGRPALSARNRPHAVGACTRGMLWISLSGRIFYGELPHTRRTCSAARREVTS